MTTYHSSLTIPSDVTDYTVQIKAGTEVLKLRFVWDSTNEEQYNTIYCAVIARRDADPLLNGTDIIRDYDWFTYYSSLPADLDTYLEEGGAYPQSLKDYDRDVQIEQLKTRISEVSVLANLLTVYEEQLVWNVEVSDSYGDIQTGTVRPGGWINNQNSNWRVRFVSDLENIGKEDLSKVFVEFEVGE